MKRDLLLLREESLRAQFPVYTGSLRVYQAEDAQEEWMLAQSPEDAAVAWLEMAGSPLDFGDGPVKWIECNPWITLPWREEEDGPIIGYRTLAQFAADGKRGHFMSANP